MAVTVSSKLYPNANLTKTVSFKTKYPPYGGTAKITPNAGNLNETDFTIYISNWQSDNQPIEYQVW